MLYLPNRRRSLRDASSIGYQNWAEWSETNQENLLCDYDKTYIAIFDAALNGADETGFGAVTGADLILSQSGSVPQAAGSPLYRQLTQASSQKFSIPVALQNILAGATDWFVLIKGSDYATAGNGLLLAWDDTAIFGGFAIRREGLGELDVVAPGLAAGVTGGLLDAADTEFYVACWRKAGGQTRFAFNVGSKITSWAGIDPAYRRFAAGSDFSITATNPALIGQRSGAEYITVKLHYLIISTEPEVFISD